MIAKLWFNYISPPPLIENTVTLPGGTTLTTYQIDEAANNIFAGLMIVSTSLALGLIFGFVIVQNLEVIFEAICVKDTTKSEDSQQRAKNRRTGMYSAPPTNDDDPESVAKEFRRALEEGASTPAEADAIFDTIDIDRSGSIDRQEVSHFMLMAGLTQEQVDSLFAAMDTDGNGEISRHEFRQALIDKVSESVLQPKKEVEETPAVTVKKDATA